MKQSFLDIPGLDEYKEDIKVLLQELHVPCFDCRLGSIQKKNHGLVWRGNPTSRMAAVSTMPGPTEMITGKPLTGESGKLFDKWFSTIQVITNTEMLVINVVQCKPPDIDKGKEVSQREPDQSELAICFPNRCLRVLKSMPNLEVVVTLGSTATECLLGKKAEIGHWYKTSLLPGKAIFCMPHPAAMLRDATPEKQGKLTECLINFQREYLETKKIMGLVNG